MSSETISQETWNGKPALANGDVWCPMCEIWHENHTFCQTTDGEF